MRYAIYFTPQINDELTALGTEWLGRDAFRDLSLPVPSNRQDLVATPARYGFHATLKAPFELDESCDVEKIRNHFDEFCMGYAAVALPTIELLYTGSSFVLGLSNQPAALTNFAAHVVRSFEPFRAPLSIADKQRRKPELLSDRQKENLEDWGYPYVMDDFRFHITLTGSVPEDRFENVRDDIEQYFAPVLNKPLNLNGLGLFVEPTRGGNFYVLDWQELRG